MSPFSRLGPWLVDPLVALERAAGAGRLGHAWLISGPRGSGKANLAYVLAARLLGGHCGSELPAPAGPRELVAACDQLGAPFDLHPDLHRIWPNDPRYKKDKDKEKRTISVEQIRDTMADLVLKPHAAGRKITLIERAETMTIEAANALLKSLEEPTPETYLLLLADRPGRLPATIRSRCQQLPLKSQPVTRTLDWLETDGLVPNSLPAPALRKPPIQLARLLGDPDFINQYNGLYKEINLLCKGRSDPHALAGSWHGGDTELALSCLVENLQWRIRRHFAPEPSKPVTDSAAALADNSQPGLSTAALFDGLKMAENLREQLGRGTNVELALKSLLLGLDPSPSQGVNA